MLNPGIPSAGVFKALQIQEGGLDVPSELSKQPVYKKVTFALEWSHLRLVVLS